MSRFVATHAPPTHTVDEVTEDCIGAAAPGRCGALVWTRPTGRAASARVAGRIARRFQAARSADVLKRDLVSDPDGCRAVCNVRARPGGAPASQRRVADPRCSGDPGACLDRRLHRDLQRCQRAFTGRQLLWATVGGGLALWQVSGAVRAIMGAFDRIYGATTERSFLRRYLVSFALSIADRSVLHRLGAVPGARAVLRGWSSRSRRGTCSHSSYDGRWGSAFCRSRSACWSGSRRRHHSRCRG